MTDSSPAPRLGHYDVTALLVRRAWDRSGQATDTQLGREVALKSSSAPELGIMLGAPAR